MSKTYPVPSDFQKNSHIDSERYDELYRQSIEDPDEFWGSQARSNLDWFQPFNRVYEASFVDGRFDWFKGGTLNASYLCIDRHLQSHGSRTAIIWEGDDSSQSQEITYNELHEHVCRLSNALLERNVGRGDRVCIYLPMIPEAAYAMLACARIGAVHSVVFGGFSANSLRDRILDSDCCAVITADEGVRGGRTVNLKANANQALADCPNVHTVVTVQRTGAAVEMHPSRDIWYHDVVDRQSSVCTPEHMRSEDPLFILYTSGSTGKPKGVQHGTAGYMLHSMLTHKYIFDYHEDDVYWCTADVGWITGHSYIVYGPLANCATTLMFEGVPTFPDSSRFWQVVDKYEVSIFYTAPTAIRQLMAEGNEFVQCTSRKSLRLLGTVGEPINPEVWEWYHGVVGERRCPVVDTWWQTETGGIMISPLPGATDLKPGSVTRPFFGIKPALVDQNGEIIEESEATGNLVMLQAWPGQIRTVYGDHQRVIDTYYAQYPGKYFTGDGARRDKDGYYWITGRVDDVINVSGHRLGTAEIESALVLHDDIAEAAVVSSPHDIKGESIYAFVTPMTSVEPNEELRQELVQLVRAEIGPIARPDVIQWAPGLPKTRSGKIMRRILRKIAADEVDDLGDTSTLADPSVVEDLLKNRITQ
ncbi:MAG: acetate--CoA ligase [Gammaproteobacteria bacterium]|nr:acetate--CoA ligase [Gammaproteobacteria bacterium]